MTDLLHFEDLPVGRSFECGPYSVTKEEIVEFAREYDPQLHHIDEEAAKTSMLGGLAASGWHVVRMKAHPGPLATMSRASSSALLRRMPEQARAIMAAT